MSVIELKQQVGGHVAFSKWDVFRGLEDAVSEARSQNTKGSPGGTITLPPTADIEGVESQPMMTQRTDNPIIVEPTTSSTETNLTAATEALPKNEVMVPTSKMDTGAQRDLMNL